MISRTQTQLQYNTSFETTHEDRKSIGNRSSSYYAINGPSFLATVIILNNHRLRSFELRARSMIKIASVLISALSTLLSAFNVAAAFSTIQTTSLLKERTLTYDINSITSLRDKISPNEAPDTNISRQEALKKIALFPILWSQSMTIYPDQAEAKVSIKPDAAFKGLVKAREELQAIPKTFLASQDYDGLRDYLADGSLSINNYEENANALLSSKQLDAESKKEIGTIRRYGVGADVIIMYGGLKAELEDNEEPRFGELSKALKRTMDSLDEVIAICRSNGFE